jgi:hypothetical protein
VLHDPLAVDLRLLSRRLHGEERLRGVAARAADAWEERVFPRFVGAAGWNAMALMTGTHSGPRGPEALRRWLQESGYGSNREFRGAFAVTLHLLEGAFGQRREGTPGMTQLGRLDGPGISSCSRGSIEHHGLPRSTRPASALCWPGQPTRQRVLHPRPWPGGPL